MSDEEKSMTVSKEMDIEGTHVLYKLISDRSSKTLDYDYKRCVGCGICVRICPTRALELGPMKEIATGLDAPPVMMELDKCTFCSMCVNFCPVNALEMRSEGDFPKEDQYPRLEQFVRMNEKCVPCSLCEATCPEDAIELEYTFPKKEDIAPLKENAEGEIEIDNDKCNLCGICARFCDAFLMLEKEPTATDPMPFEQLIIDEDSCDYCTLCQDICPEDAIKVKGEKPCEAPEVSGKVTVDDAKCTRCGWCDAVCPYDAVDMLKPFEGELMLVESHIQKCDAQGCHACFNICPSHLWYVPDDGKNIAAVYDLCTYCGACVNACPEDVMKVFRTKVSHTKIPESPWANEWKNAIGSLLTEERKHPDLSRTIEVENGPMKEHVDIKFPEVDEKMMEAVSKKLELAKDALNDPRTRRTLNKGEVDDIHKAMKKMKGKGKL
ncbi:4Fe-4S binding protein [Methanococcoides burtonii]|uniref:4Fe-4S ferredoxin, iron-sulfur binding domain protein n=1 Tax=Methanococcoides burtonii (strain DSM 6242 / NBRC 107633 / OCM 468 / ACE-M) TaxID=259564 RepID=Q12YE8_METBU|nr:4Fe-4S binding protein [Methanococcoides burtonii]ABE51528.1 4Fe-4S ferredoxin, iron-sulfur binding domain protein [Methanococcoides burtonii DSM 6242]